MSINLQQIFNTHKIEYRDSGKELSSGWIAFACPWCADAKSHMGYSERLGMFTCWRCGVKNDVATLMKILKLPFEEIKKLIKRNFIVGSIEHEQKERAKEIFLPNNSGKLLAEHRKYLKARRFDPLQIERDWNVVGSLSFTFKNRILIPIFYKGELVSYHSRDITGRHDVRTKACPTDKERIPHRELLYGFDKVPGNTVIVSEGPFDVWRWGAGAVGTFGIKTTEKQLELLRCFKNILIIFDGGKKEKLAQKAAQKLADKISAFHNTWVIDIGCDPADLKQNKANRIKRELIKMVGKQ